VGGSQSVGIGLGKEARVPAAVVAHRDGAPTEVDDLDQVGVTGLPTVVVVVAAMDRIDRAGSNRVVGLLVRRVEHGARLCGGRRSSH
jgi:hypothetical protein